MTVAPFDACGPLPSGVTVLEASAGTGKTFTIAALATRYVAEGLPLDHLLIVTFTRMATSELRDRVRERMVSAEQGLNRALLGVEPDPTDDVLRLFACGPDDEVRRRRDRLTRALSDFDAATIATTHGFCQHVLNGLGVAGDVERDVAFVEDSRYLVDEAVADLYVRFFHRPDHPAKFTLAQALKIGELAVGNPDAALMPADAPHNSTPQLRYRLATRVRQEVDRRRRLAAALTYDDLLTRLRDTLADPVRGETACRRLRERYKVALVDEFQDTDPIQWEIMRRAFAEPGSTLVLIGDPKQAIYAFRGADVYAYLEAAQMAGTRATLEVNWRSDQGLLDAFDALFAGARLGHEGIVYRDVRAAPGNVARRMPGPPLRVRVLHRDDGLVKLTSSGCASLADSRAVIAADLAGDVVRLLASRVDVAGRTVRPGDIAVLVHRNRDALAVRDALDDAGVPAVVNGAGSVFGTTSAQAWLRLLAALERPAGSSTARLAALSPFIGWSAERVALADEAAWEDLHARLHRWAAVLRLRGVAALFETISRAERLDRRVLQRTEGERQLTDLRHIAQLLHGVATAEQLGMTALTGWLRERIDEAGEEDDAEDRSRRLESDAEAVQVLTIYRSKGLEFPVVYCPYLWDPGYIPEDEPPIFHDDNGRRTIDVGGDGGPETDTGWAHIVERRGEELRLAYVALTRARHQAVVWWAGTWAARQSALCRLLFFRDADGNVRPGGNRTPTDDESVARFEELCLSVERVDGGAGEVWVDQAPSDAGLAVGRFNRALDPTWRRTSYSGITSGAHEARVSSEEEERWEPDEVLVVPRAEDVAVEPALRAVPSLLATMPGGADVGTFVHGVLEAADFTAGDLAAELWASLEQTAAREAVDVGDRSLVVAGLAAAVDTPLGPVVGDLRLRNVGRGDRVDELGFELPLCGGDTPAGTLSVDRIGALLVEHLPVGDPFAGYAPRLSDPVLQSDLRGYLSGSLDLVFRTADRRYAVVDYKTNWLGVEGEPLSAWHYRPAALLEAMFAAHYPLQALLYTVALHRYLRWRVAGYDPARDIAGVLYLFVRGMVGAETPVVDGSPCGVFGWRPPASLVEALSDLLDRGDAVIVVEEPFDVAVARGATGLLRTFNEAGVLSAADVHVAQRLGRLCGEASEPALLAAAFAARAPRLAHVCIDLATARERVSVDTDLPVDVTALPWPSRWVDEVAASPLVAAGGPLQLAGTRLYLDRYWREERQVAADLRARGQVEASDVDHGLLAAGLSRLFSGEPPDYQRLAAATAVLRSLAVVAGGPGTGKTTTVARVLALLHEQAVGAGQRPPLVALAAPTGKAAARLEEAVHQEATQLPIAAEARDWLLGLSAVTLHRLLGWQPGNRARFRHDRRNRLPHGVVVVDETSMVALTMMARVLEAVRPAARLVLVGDPDQLASVEAGAVLGDIVGPAAERLLLSPHAARTLSEVAGHPVEASDPPADAAVADGIVVLRTVHRFRGAIAQLADAVQRGDADAAVEVLSADHDDVRWLQVDVATAGRGALHPVRDAVIEAGTRVSEAAAAGRGREALSALGGFRLLCAHRRGPYGVSMWTAQVERWLGLAGAGGWYPGRPLLVTENDYGLGLYNGDTGVVVAHGEAGAGAVRAVFERRGELLELSPQRLASVDTVYAMTVHKAQGSQFDQVAVLLPDPTSPILTRELLYTAITRARRRLILVGTEETVRSAVERPITRASGLRESLWDRA